MVNEIKQMPCPKCGGENPDDARFCNSCGCSLTQADATSQTVSVKISRMAIVAFIGVLCGLALLVPSLIAVEFPRVLSPRLGWVVLTHLISLIALGVSLILGLISMIRIERSGGRITGRAFAIGAILLLVFGGLLPIWRIIVRQPRSTAFRMVCGTNLSRIGKAMLIYSNDYEDELPRAGGKTSVWTARIPDWKAANRSGAYNIQPDGSGGQVSISASFYLLVKYAKIEPTRFLCKQDSRVKEFKPGLLKMRGKELTDLWDFGPEPWKHYSFSYHNPYGSYALTTSLEPALAVVADRNPWMLSPAGGSKDFSKFDPDGDREAVKTGNTIGHQEDGQNVLFLDSHVGFEKNSFCGVNDDNIYTYWDGEDIRRGATPVLGSEPKDRSDSLLVHDPPAKPK
ncbi:MAG: hypothetical protein ACYSWW_02930 [Planctomycetota bacterium]